MRPFRHLIVLIFMAVGCATRVDQIDGIHELIVRPEGVLISHGPGDHVVLVTAGLKPNPASVLIRPGDWFAVGDGWGPCSRYLLTGVDSTTAHLDEYRVIRGKKSILPCRSIRVASYTESDQPAATTPAPPERSN